MQLNLQEFEPCFLIATPELRDPNFHQTVVLLLEYRAEGAFGVVVNRPLNTSLGEAKSSNVEIAPPYQHAPLWYGGPVRSQEILCLYETLGDPIGDDTTVNDTLGIAPSKCLLVGAEQRTPFPADYRIVVGHSMWGPAQLDQEIQVGAWLASPLHHDIIFASDPNLIWKMSLKRLGVDPQHFYNVSSSVPN